MLAHVEEMLSVRRQLRDAGVQIEDQQLAIYVRESLPPAMDVFKQVTDMNGGHLDAYLQGIETYQLSSGSEKASYTQSHSVMASIMEFPRPGDPAHRYCVSCKKSGDHTVFYCPNVSNPKGIGKGKKNKRKEETHEIEVGCSASDVCDHTDWLVDSGASVHISNQRSDFVVIDKR